MPTPNRIKVSCKSCGVIMKVDDTEAMPPCDECGGKLVPIDAPLRAEMTPLPEPIQPTSPPVPDSDAETKPT